SMATKPADLLPSVGPPRTESEAFVFVSCPAGVAAGAGGCASAVEASRHRTATSDTVATTTHRFIETPRISVAERLGPTASRGEGQSIPSPWYSGHARIQLTMSEHADSSDLSFDTPIADD